MSTPKQAALAQVESMSHWRAARESTMTKRRAPLQPQQGFEGPDGPLTLLELIEEKAHLILYHFKFTPSVVGAPSTGCSGCQMYIDNIDRAALVQLSKRDASFALVSRAPVENLQAYKKRMSWKHAWVSSANSMFNSDNHGISIFSRHGDRIDRRYLTVARGSENVGPIWNLLDVKAFESVS